MLLMLKSKTSDIKHKLLSTR